MRTSLRALAARCLFLRVDADVVLRDGGSIQASDCLYRRCVAMTRRRFPVLTVTRMKVPSPAVSAVAWTPDGLPNAQQEKAARPGIQRSKQIVNRHVDNNNGSGLLLGRQKEIHDPRG